MTDDILDRDPLADDGSSTDEPATDPEATPTAGRESDESTPVTAATVPSAATDLAAGEVGHVMASEGIRVGRGDHSVAAFVATERRNAVRVGDYVEVPYPDAGETLLAIVDGLRYEPYTDLDDRSDAHNRIAATRGFDEAEFVLAAELEPIAIVAGDERRIVNRVPKPNAAVRLARDERTLRTGLNVPHDGVFCGYLSVAGERLHVDGDPLPYYLTNPGIDPESGDVEDGEPAVFRHALIAGSTGKGKTHFTKNLLRQFVAGKRYPITQHDTGRRLEKELNVVVLDPENEYAELRDDNPDLDPGIARDLRRQGVAVGGIDDLDVFVPEVARTNPPSVGERRSFGIPFELVADRPQLLMPYEASDVTRNAIVTLVNDYFNRDAVGDDRSTYDGFLTYLDRREESLIERHDLTEMTFGAVQRRVQDPAYRAVFDRGAAPVTEITGDLFRAGQVTVIPTSHLRGGKEELVVLSLLSLIIDNKIGEYDVDPHIKDTPMLVAVDEAHNYVGDPDTLRGRYIVGRARAAAKRGRKDKLGLCLITQNPEDVDEQVLKQINTNVFLGLRDEVVRSVPSVPSGYADDIPKFGKGQAVVKAPDVEAVEVVGLPQSLTRHDS